MFGPNIAEYLDLPDTTALRKLLTEDDELLKLLDEWVRGRKVNFSIHQDTPDKAVAQKSFSSKLLSSCRPTRHAKIEVPKADTTEVENEGNKNES